MKADLVGIFDAANGIEAQLLAARLGEQGIEAFVDNNDSPLSGLTAAEQSVPVRVLAADEPRARPIVEDFMREQGWDADSESDEP